MEILVNTWWIKERFLHSISNESLGIALYGGVVL